MNNYYTNKSPIKLRNGALMPDLLFGNGKAVLKSGKLFQARISVVLTALLFGVLTSVCSGQTQTFTTSGTYTVPAGVTSVTVAAWGGGGGGGLASGSANGKGGGGGGAYASSTLTVTPGAQFTVTVGAAGVGGTSSVNATSGGSSSFAASVVALGGTNASNTTSSGAGGAGGLASGSTGTIKFNGGTGGTGNTASGGGGGGGGSSATSAGVGVNGGNASGGTGGAGGNGTDGDGGAGGNNNAAGVDGTAPGGGGGGRGDVGSSSGDGGIGQVKVTWTCPTYALTAAATATGPFCGASTSVVTLKSSSLPSGTYTVTYNLTGANTATGSTATMTFTAGSPGTGTFTTSSLANAGTTTVTVTILTSAGCSSTISSNNTVTVSISAAATAVAGTAITTCSNSGAVNITAGSSATNNAGITWTCNGTGTFTNANSLTLCTYAPSAADITAGSRTLTLTATGNAPCSNVVSTKTITINQAPAANAGTPVVSCYSSGSINITAGSSASNQASVTWTSSGTGSFSNATSLSTAAYTPSAADITAGGVTLTLTANPLAGCTSSTSTKALTITAAPTAVAGTAITTCSNLGAVAITTGSSATNNAGITWSCSGTGTFANANSLTTCTYTPSSADITAGSVTLTLTATGNGTCSNATSTKTLTIHQPPTSNAGTAVSTCSSTGAVNITAGSSASNQASVTWTSSGTGTFSNANSLTTATYTPSSADISAGSVTLTLTAVATSGCSNVTSTKSLTIIQAATAVAGTNISTCGNLIPVNITAGSSATNNSGITWTSNGTGTFSNANSLTLCTYTPSVADVSAGSRTLTLTANGNSPCGNITSNKTISFIAIPSAVSASPASSTVCSSTSSVALSGNATTTATVTVNSDNFNGTPTYTGTGSTTGNRSQIFSKETSGTNVNSVGTFTSPNGGGVMIALAAASGVLGTSTSSANTLLNSPAINTNNFTTLTLTYNHTYKQGNTGSPSGKVEVSTNGSTWTTLKTFTTDQGGTTSFVADNLILSSLYLNQSNLQLRFNFVSSNSSSFFASNASWWAIDDVLLNGIPVPFYSWTSNTGIGIDGLPAGAGTSSVANKDIIVTPAATTTYTVTATDAVTGCTNTSTAIVTVNDLATVSAGSNQTICSDEIATMAGSFGGGASSAIWTTSGSGLFSNNNVNAVYTPSGADIASGSVTLTYTTDDPAGPCGSVNASMILTIHTIPSISVSPADVIVCEGGNATFTVTAAGTGLTYQWRKGNTDLLNGGVFSGVTTAALVITGAGTIDTAPDYNCVVSGTCPLSVTSANASLTVNSAPTIVSLGNISINNSGNCSINISNAELLAQVNVTGVPSPAVTFIPAAGNFSVGTTVVTATALNSCGSVNTTFNVIITDDEFPILSSCPGNIILNNEPGNCFAHTTWIDPVATDNCSATVVCVPSSGSSFPIGTTTIICTASDPSNNSVSCSFTVTVADTELPVISNCPADISQCDVQLVTFTNPTATDNCSAAVVCDPSSGSVFDFGTTLVTCTATDPYGLFSVCSFHVTINESPEFNGANVTDNQCFGDFEGEIDVSANVENGTLPYSYLWSNSQTTSIISGLPGGTYTVTVTDFAGCSATLSLYVLEPTPIVVTSIVSNVSCFGNSNGAIDLTVNGGTSPYTFDWSNSANTEDITGLTAGIYDVFISDALFCPQFASISITEPGELVASESHTNVLCNGGTTGTITINATGGTAPYTGTGIITGLSAGTYSYTVTDANGCTSSVNVIISEPLLLTSSEIHTDVLCNGNSSGTATISATGGTAPYSGTGLITGLAAGNYSYTVTDANGCTSTVNVIISEPALLVASESHTDILCYGELTGTATITATGGSVPYTGTGVFTGLAAGSYSYVVTDANNCTATVSVIIATPDLLEATCGSSDVTCIGGNDGTAIVTGNGGTEPYSYLWNDNSTSDVLTGLPAGTYTVTVTDANGCSATCESTVSQPSPLTLIATIDNPVSCNGGNNGQATVTANDGTPGYSYLWSDAQATATAIGLSAGNYTVLVTDNCGSTAIASVTITEPLDPISLQTQITDLQCHGDANGEIDITPDGGTAPYTFLWSNLSNTEDLTGLSAGTYAVTVTDANGCVFNDSFNVNQPDLLVVTGLTTAVNCFGNSTGAIDISVTGGTPGYAYEWSNSSIDEDLSGLSAGIYTVTVSDAFNCLTSATYTISEPSLLIATETHTDVLCNGGSTGTATINATGGTAPYTGTGLITDLSAGTYSYTVTDANGCTSQVSVSISEPAVLAVSETHTNALNNGGSNGTATITATGGTAPYTGTGLITGLAAGTYSYTVTDANGCSASLSITITEPAVFVASETHTDVLCNGGSNGTATISATGGIAPYSGTGLITGLAAGTYSYTVTDANNYTTSVNVIISEPSLLVASEIHTDALCNGTSTGTATISATGGTAPYTGTGLVTGLASGSYSYTVTDANGCSSIVNVNISEPSVLVATETHTEVLCNGGSTGTATINATGGTAPYTGTGLITGLSAGSYSYTVTDVNGCTSNVNVIISEPILLTASAVVDNTVSCFGGNNGQATVTANDGTPGYLYLWSDAQATATATGLIAGNYTVIVTDNCGSTSMASVTITEPLDPISLQTQITDLQCHGDANGEIDITPDGGTSPYTFLWSNLSNSEDLTGLSAGSYAVTVTDANGCIYTESFDLTQPDLLVVTGVTTAVNCYGGTTGAIDISVSGGTPGYAYEWSNSSIDEDLSGLPAGIYTVTVSDAFNCLTSATYTITEPTLLVASETHTDVICNGGSTGTATINATGGTAPYTGTGLVTGLAAGAYSYTVTDANGCTSQVSVTISEPALLLASEVHTDALCNGGSTGTATIIANGGTAPYSGTGLITGLAAGTYSYTVTDANGCSSQVSVTISEPAVLLASEIHTDALCNGSSTGTATISATGGTAPYTGTGLVTGLAAGTYSYTVTDANGCSSIVNVNISEPPVLVATETHTDVLCNGGSTGSVTISATGGTAPYTGTGLITGLAAGTYSYSVTDASGCTSQVSVTISEPAVLAVSETHTNALNNGGSNGTATITATGGTAPYTGTGLITGLAAGTYSYTVTDANGCSASLSITITEPAVFVASETHTDVLCNGGSNGTATISATGGTAPYSGTGLITGLAAGTYSYTVTDANNYTTSVNVIISEPSLLVASEIHTDALCNGTSTGTATISATGGTAPYTGTGLVTGLASGSYSYTVTDANGCSSIVNVNISEPSVLVATETHTDVLCNGGSTGTATINATGGTAPYTGTGLITGLSAGSYSYTVTDVNGCTSNVNVIISEPILLTASAVVDNTVSCFGGNNGQATVTANDGTPGYLYLWSDAQATATATGLIAGNYTVIVTDNCGSTSMASVTITEPLDPISLQTQITDLQCHGDANGEIDITPDGGTSPYTFLWSNLSNSEDLTGLSAGSYAVTVTDANGCIYTESFDLTQPDLLVVTGVTTAVNCYGGTTGAIDISVSGGTPGYAYEWSNSSIDEDLSGLPAGIYTVTVSDAFNCLTSATYTITEPTLLVASETHTDVICNGGSTGTATINATGGTAPYTGTGLVTGLAAGAYSYTVTDANGCTSQVSVTISEPALLLASEVHTDALCNGGSTGTATINASGGTAPYSGTGLITGLAAGTYSYTVTDANGCSSQVSVTISEPAVLAVSETHTNALNNGGSNGTATITATGGTAPYTGTGLITGLAAGTYSYTVTDANGCSASLSITITEPAVFVASETHTDVLCNGGSNGTATISATGGTAPYSGTGLITGLAAGTYSYTVTDANNYTTSVNVIISEPSLLVASEIHTDALCNGSSTGTATISATGGTAPYTGTGLVTGLAAGTYSYTVTDANGCSSIVNVNISEPSVLVATETHTDVLCNGGSTGTATINATGGTAPYTGTGLITGLSAGSYSYTVTDVNGCTSNVNVIISEPILLTASAVVDNTVSCFGGNNGQATVTANDGTPGYLYLWSDAQATATATGLIAGNYTVIVTDNCGSTSMASVTITEPLDPISLQTQITDLQCHGDANGEIDITPDGGTSPYTFLWSNLSNSEDLTGLSAGSYAVTVTDANGCIYTESFDLTQPDLLVVTGVTTAVNCYGGTTGAIDISVSGGTPGYAYEWSNSSIDEDLSGLPAGIYTVTVSDAFNCLTSATYTIIEPTLLVASETHTEVICNGGSTGTATINATGGTAPYTGTGLVTGLAAGAYSYTVTDANGCTSQVSVTISEPALLLASEVHTDALCNGGSTGTATINASGGTAPYSGTGLITGLAAGTYSYTVTDANGCSSQVSVTISEPAVLLASEIHTDALCNGSSTGTATISATGGTAPYTGTGLVTGLAAGTYSYTITDANGCTTSVSIAIAEPAVLAASETHTNVLNNGGSNGTVTISATGGTAPYTGTGLITGLAAGTYSYTVTDANGCTSLINVTISEPAILVASESHTDVLCNGGSTGTATISATGGTAPYTGIGLITGLAAGTYSYTVTDANNYTAIVNVTISEPALLVASETHTDVLCNGGSTGTATINATGGTAPYTGTGLITDLSAGTYSYTVTDANGCTSQVSVSISEPAVLAVSETHTNALNNGSSNGTATISATGGTAPYTGTGLITGLAAGTYSYTVTDVNGCSASISVTITEPDVFVATETHTDVLCNGGSNGTATISATGGTAPYTGTGLITGLAAGTYVYTVTDANNFTTSVNVIISEPSLLVASEIHTDALCNGTATGTATISATGGIAPYTGTGLVTGLAAGNYSYTVTDANGCSSVVNVNISEPAVLTASETHTNVLCNGGSTGTATINASGGTAPYTGTGLISGLAAGNYSYTVTDANGCSSTVNVTISEPMVLTATAVADNAVSCFGGNNGQATVTANDGTPGYSYLWSDAQATATATGLSAGNYTVQVTDNCGSTAIASVTITEPLDPISLQTQITDLQCHGDANGEIDITPGGGTAPYTFLWSNLSSSEDLTGLSAGSYTVTVTDANGCVYSETFDVTQPDLLVVTGVTTAVNCFGNSTGSIDISVTGGTPLYAYEWSNSSIDEDLSGLPAGIYTVTVSDAFNCLANATYTITEPSVLVAAETHADVLCNGTSTGTATISATGGTAPYTGTGLVTGLSAGTYSYTVTDANGCTSLVSVTISEPAALAGSETHTDVLCNGGSTGTATINATGGTAPYSGTGLITGLAAGTYSYTVTDANGCTTQVNVAISEPVVLVASETHTDVLCNGSSTGTVTISATGGTAPYTGTGLVTGLSAGTYSYTVTDANGCTTQVNVAISEPVVLVASETHTDVLCNGSSTGTVTISATGGTTPYTGTGLITGLAAGTYSYTVTDANGCTSAVSVTISESAVLSAGETHTNVLCNGGSTGSVTITATGGTAPYTGTGLITGLAAGTYSYTVTDANGCTSLVPVTISEPAVLTASETHTNVLCNGGSTGTATISASGGTPPYSGTGIITGLAAGTHTFNIADANGCTSQVSVIISEPIVLATSETHTNILCNGGSTGTATISATGGTAPYTGTGLVSGLAAGTYSYTVTDANGCNSSISVTISEPNVLVASEIHTDVLCNGGATGTVTINATGGTEPYTGTGQFTGLAAGTYTYTVTDAHGCSSQVPVTIVQPAVITVTTQVGYAGCTGVNGFVTSNVSGGVEPYSYLWSTSATSGSIGGITAGSYTVTVTDSKGCVSVKQSVLAPYIPVTTGGIATNIACRGINTGSIILNPTGGTGPYTFLWNNGATIQNRTALAAGSYMVTVKDAYLCSSTASYTITTPATSLLINYNKTNIRCYGLLSGSITAGPAGGTPPYTYSWNTLPVQTNATISGLAAGVYTCVVTDFNGCTKSILVDITQPPAIVVVPSQTNVTFPGGNNGSISLAVSGGTPGFTYAWNTIPVKTTASIIGLIAGVYKCTVSDSKGCQVKLSFTITEPIAKPISKGSEESKWNLVIYPNPSNGMIHVKIAGLRDAEIVEISLSDISGRVVYKNQVNWLEDDERLFDFTGIAKGAYYMNCKSKSDNLIKKIIIE